MILRIINNSLLNSSIRYTFSSVSVDYYKLLQVQKGAPLYQIEQSYKKLIANVYPDQNAKLFHQLHQAFIILSDGKSRDAYDSLSHLRPITLETLTKPKTPETQTLSYIAERKELSRKKLQKEMNIDKFGRYKGGLPNPLTQFRGKSRGQTGTLHDPMDNLKYEDYEPAYCQVDAARAQSFKNYHMGQKMHRVAKPTWYTVTVSYDFFNPIKLFHTTQWKFMRVMIAIYLSPLVIEYMIGARKRAAKKIATLKKQMQRSSQSFLK